MTPITDLEEIKQLAEKRRDDFEVMLYILQGKVRHEFGEHCKEVLDNQAGDFIFIKPGVPHEVFNIGEEEVVAVVARSDAGEWANIVNYDRETGQVIDD